jgi:hypothetical protein
MERNHKEIELINMLLANLPKKYATSHDQMLYERGYLTGLLATMAHNDSSIRVALMHCIEHLKKN